MVSIIIPIHKFNTKTKSFFLKETIPSVSEVLKETDDLDVLIVGNSEIKKEIDEMKLPIPVTFIENEKTDFQTQMNVAVKASTKPYFMLLEFDDVLPVSTYFNRVKEFIKECPKVSAFMPIVCNMYQNNGNMVFNSFSNFITFAGYFYFKEQENPNKYKKYGNVDFEVCERDESISIDGCVIEKDAFLAVGGLKTKIDIAFNYEFFMRFANEGHSIKVIPRIGYYHTIEREDSLYDYYKKSTNPQQLKNATDVAKREYHFKIDRDIL